MVGRWLYESCLRYDPSASKGEWFTHNLYTHLELLDSAARVGDYVTCNGV
jgi:hypothetical protein